MLLVAVRRLRLDVDDRRRVAGVDPLVAEFRLPRTPVPVAVRRRVRQRRAQREGEGEREGEWDVDEAPVA